MASVLATYRSEPTSATPNGEAKWSRKMLRVCGLPPPFVSRSRVMRLLSPVWPPDVTHDSIQPTTMSFGRRIGWTFGDLDSTTKMSPFGMT
jgi:hypothetical protein